jgi:abortive infection bacteriophage resistance protein
LRSLQEIQPDFEEEAKTYAGLWSQGKKKKREEITRIWGKLHNEFHNFCSSPNVIRTIKSRTTK